VECCFEVMYLYVGSGCRLCNYLYYYLMYMLYLFFVIFGVLPPHSNHIRNAHRWCTVKGSHESARREGTLAMDLGLEGIRTHM